MLPAYRLAPEQTYPKALHDALIVGSGFGCSVSAYRLAESEGINKISVVEAKQILIGARVESQKGECLRWPATPAGENSA